MWTYLTEYFPDSFEAEVHVAVVGNRQHNPGEKLHWARGKSPDQLDTVFRHMWDHKTVGPKDTDGCYHLAKAIWRLKAELQLVIEAERAAKAKLKIGAIALAAAEQIPLDKIELGSWNDVERCEANCAVTAAKGFWNHARGEWEGE